MDLQLTFAKNVLLSATSFMSSPPSAPDAAFPSSGLIFSDIPSRLSLAFDSAAEFSSWPAFVGEMDSVFKSASAFPAPSSSSFFGEHSSTGLLGPATTVDGSAVSNALSNTYTVHQGSCLCLCRSLQNDLVRFVRLHAAQTGVFGSNGFCTQNGCHWTIRTVSGLSTYFPCSSRHDSSKVMQI